eukprot:6218869-Amphidinium_carterae.1
MSGAQHGELVSATLDCSADALHSECTVTNNHHSPHLHAMWINIVADAIANTSSKTPFTRPHESVRQWEEASGTI